MFLNLYMEPPALQYSIAVIIIRVFSETLRAKQEVIKTAKCTWSSRDCIRSNFYLTKHLLNVSLKRKNRQHSHHHVAYDNIRERESKCRWLLVYVSLMLPVWWNFSHHWMPASKMLGNLQRTNSVLFVVNCNICQQETEICKPSWDKWLICRIPAPCCNMPPALAHSSIVIRIMMMEMRSAFRFSETHSANDLWDKNCFKCNISISMCILRFWAFPALHVEFCWILE